MNLLARFLLIVFGGAIILLGVHGLIVYFSPLEVFFKDPSSLFLEIDVPSKFQSMIEWMSTKGLQSWGIPVLFICIGLCCWFLQTKLHSSKTTKA